MCVLVDPEIFWRFELLTSANSTIFITSFLSTKCLFLVIVVSQEILYNWIPLERTKVCDVYATMFLDGMSDCLRYFDLLKAVLERARFRSDDVFLAFLRSFLSVPLSISFVSCSFAMSLIFLFTDKALLT